jgi:hypothetical protein
MMPPCAWSATACAPASTEGDPALPDGTRYYSLQAQRDSDTFTLHTGGCRMG